MTNRELVERQIDAANRLAFDEVGQLGADDIVVDFSRSIGPARGVYRGKEEVRVLLESTLDAFERIDVTPIDMYERGDWVAVAVAVLFRGRGSGAEVEARGGRAYQVRDSKIARVVQFQNMADAREYVDAQA